MIHSIRYLYNSVIQLVDHMIMIFAVLWERTENLKYYVELFKIQQVNS